MMTVLVGVTFHVVCFLVDNPTAGKWNYIHQIDIKTTKIPRCWIYGQKCRVPLNCRLWTVLEYVLCSLMKTLLWLLNVEQL